MKTSLFLTFAAAGMLFATSCSQDDAKNVELQDYVEAKFQIDPFVGMSTRADIGSGKYANTVTCAVFDENGDEMTALRQDVAIKNMTAEYSVRLVKGQEYRIAFFAHRIFESGLNYYDVTDMKNIYVKHAPHNYVVNANQESRDAFTNFVDISAERSMTAIDTTVCLYRPFAQLNIGATEEDIQAAEDAGVVVAKTQVKVSNVYTAFNAYENAVTGETSEFTYRLSKIRTEALEANGNEYAYLSLNYLLVGDVDSEKSLTNVEFIWENEDGSKTNAAVPTVFSNIPVQRNYRTNILGWILTNPADFNIVVVPDFEDPDYNVAIEDEIVNP